MIDYSTAFGTLNIDLQKMGAAQLLADKIRSNKLRYDEVENMTGVPWYVIGAIHYRESSFNFKRHLHNGDPLTQRTSHVPSGRPIKGNPPFTWIESAVDALKLKRWNLVTDWSIGNALSLIERYNGLGYKNKGLPSPYIWSWSSVYKKGKYVSDGKFDPEFVDKQCGTAILIKLLM